MTAFARKGESDAHMLNQSGGHVKRLVRNRVALQQYLDSGRITGRSGFAIALRELGKAIKRGEFWAVKLALQYAVGTPQQVNSARESQEPPGDFNFHEVEQTLREIRTTTRSARLPIKADRGDDT